MRRKVQPLLFPLATGTLGAFMLSGLYLGVVSLAESPQHAFALLWEDKALVIPILLGFGVQVGLYTALKQGLFLPRPVASSGGHLVAGGGISTVAMVACCAHHVTDVLPLVGLTAAAAFLANWKALFLVAGVLTNLLGITVMVRLLLKERQRAMLMVATPGQVTP